MPTISWPAWGTTVSVQTLDPAALPSARRLVELCLRSGEKVADAQRPRSELSRLSRAAGRPVSVSPLLADLVQAGVEAAELSDGLCDPTVGNLTTAGRLRAMQPHGTPLIPVCGNGSATASRPAVRGWQALRVQGRQVQVPGCTRLDLSSPAKAFLAVRAASHAARSCRTGVLVELGGAVATAGPSPVGGWRVATDGGVFRLPSGASLATSHTRGLVDPRTGRPVQSPWHSVTVLGGDCVAAAALALAAHVIGADAAPWLIDHGVTTARLVTLDGSVVHLGSLATSASSASTSNTGNTGKTGKTSRLAIGADSGPQQGLALASAS